MKAESQRPEGREGTIGRLNAALEAMSLAEKVSSITPAKIVFGSVGVLLALIKVCFLLLCSVTIPGSQIARTQLWTSRIT